LQLPRELVERVRLDGLAAVNIDGDHITIRPAEVRRPDRES
jgi:hypothetical protein